MAERIKALEDVMILNEAYKDGDSFFDVDEFDSRDGKVRFPEISDRIDDLEKFSEGGEAHLASVHCYDVRGTCCR